MARWLLIILVPLAGVLRVHAAPGSKETPADPPLYPLTQGTKWVYDVGGREFVEVVTGVQKKEAETVLDIGSVGDDGKVRPMVTLVLSEKGVLRTKAVGEPLATPQLVLGLPAKAGDKWTIHVPARSGVKERTGTFTVRGVENVEVPAGKFPAVKVEAAWSGPELKSWTSTYWYAPGTGLVKADNGNGGAQVLKSFTPGKE
jgi:hypothetical protein